MENTPSVWPDIPYAGWRETLANVHMWTQVVGKIRLVQSPWVNHSWHVTLYVTPRGLTTMSIPHGDRTFQLEMDFIDHVLVILVDSGIRRTIPLVPQTTADFYRALMGALAEIGLPVSINARPNEVDPAIPFAEDTRNAAYDAAATQRFWQALVRVDRVFKTFRSRFSGKCSPVHFFWGSFDLAVTRFSGRTAPPHPGGYPNIPDAVMQEAYSHEVSSAGFWPGSDEMPEPIFFSYAYPTPDGMSEEPVQPAGAGWHSGLGEFVLPYEAIRTSASPEADLLAFLESTYQAAADAAVWDSAALASRPPSP